MKEQRDRNRGAELPAQDQWDLIEALGPRGEDLRSAAEIVKIIHEVAQQGFPQLNVSILPNDIQRAERLISSPKAREELFINGDEDFLEVAISGLALFLATYRATEAKYPTHELSLPTEVLSDIAVLLLADGRRLFNAAARSSDNDKLTGLSFMMALGIDCETHEEPEEPTVAKVEPQSNPVAPSAATTLAKPPAPAITSAEPRAKQSDVLASVMGMAVTDNQLGRAKSLMQAILARASMNPAPEWSNPSEVAIHYLQSKPGFAERVLTAELIQGAGLVIDTAERYLNMTRPRGVQGWLNRTIKDAFLKYYEEACVRRPTSSARELLADTFNQSSVVTVRSTQQKALVS